MGSSNKDTSVKDDRSQSVAREYFPLAPEQWREKIRDFKQLYVMKYSKII